MQQEDWPKVGDEQMNQVVQLLATVPNLKEIHTPAAMRIVARSARVLDIGAGEVLLQEYDPVSERSFCFLVVHGTLSVHKKGRNETLDTESSHILDRFGSCDSVLCEGELIAPRSMLSVKVESLVTDGDLDPSSQFKEKMRDQSVIAREQTRLIRFSINSYLVALAEQGRLHAVNNYMQVRNLFLQPVNDRSDDMVARAVQTLSDFPCLESFSKSCLEQLARVAVLKSFEPNAVVFAQGETSCDYYYIILTGQVSIHVKQAFAGEGKKTEAESEVNLDRTLQRSASPNGPKTEDWDNRYGKLVVLLGSGDGFGERSIMKKSSRGGTAICRETTELLLVTSAEYLTIFETDSTPPISMSSKVVSVLARPRNLRSPEDIDFLVSTLQRVNFFGTFENHTRILYGARGSLIGDFRKHAPVTPSQYTSPDEACCHSCWNADL